MKNKLRTSRKFIRYLIKNVQQISWKEYTGIERLYTPFFAQVGDKVVYLQTFETTIGDEYGIKIKMLTHPNITAQTKFRCHGIMKKLFKAVEGVVRTT